MYISFQKIAYKIDTETMTRCEDLHEEPGPAHALDATNTREGDPWRSYGTGRRLVSRDPHFYEHGGPRAACGRRGLVALPGEYNAEDEDSCPECAELVRSGEAWGRFLNMPFAEVVRIKEDGEIVPHECRLRWDHRGPHRAAHGTTWETGPGDFKPDGCVTHARSGSTSSG